MERNTRICCFCETWESGGIESFLFNVITHMDRRDLEIDIVAAQIKDSVFTDKLKACGVRFYQLSGRLTALPANWRSFRRLLYERQYDVLHLNIYHALSLRYAALAHAAGVPKIIAHSHNTALRKSPARPAKLLIHALSKRLWARYATDFWACSGAAAKFLFPADIAAGSYKFIPNGIELERFRFSPEGRAETRRELGIADDTLLIGNVGRLCYQKNQSFLLDVFASVHKERPNSRLLLVGDGELRGELERKADALGLSDSVIFYGVTEHVERLLWAMDLFAFPSRFEGLSVAAIEAQTAGLPLLCSMQPCEICLSAAARMQPLELGADNWARELLDMLQESIRDNAYKTVYAAGFHINLVAKAIEKQYQT